MYVSVGCHCRKWPVSVNGVGTKGSICLSPGSILIRKASVTFHAFVSVGSAMSVSDRYVSAPLS